MKLIEAMKRVKLNKEKVADLHAKIGQNCAHLSHETPLYAQNPAGTIEGWARQCDDVVQENIRLLVAIARTNMATDVTIELGERQVTKKIAEWVWRRREYAAMDQRTWAMMTDRNLREGTAQSSTGVPVEVKLVRYYDPALRDKMLRIYMEEPKRIDAAMEVVNAVTDLIEA